MITEAEIDAAAAAIKLTSSPASSCRSWIACARAALEAAQNVRSDMPEIASPRAELAHEAEQSKICPDSYAAENQRFSDEIESLRTELTAVKAIQSNGKKMLTAAHAHVDELRAAARQDAEALDRYRYAIAFAGADSWDGGPDMRQRLEWARANDPGGNLTNDRIAEIGQTFPVHMRAIPRQDAEEIARLKEDRTTELRNEFEGIRSELETTKRQSFVEGLNEAQRQYYPRVERLEAAARQDAEEKAHRDVEIASLRFEISELTWTKNDNAVQIANLRVALARAEEALESIARYTPSSVVQPVQIARAARACRPQGEKS